MQYISLWWKCYDARRTCGLGSAVELFKLLSINRLYLLAYFTCFCKFLAQTGSVRYLKQYLTIEPYPVDAIGSCCIRAGVGYKENLYTLPLCDIPMPHSGPLPCWCLIDCSTSAEKLSSHLTAPCPILACAQRDLFVVCRSSSFIESFLCLARSQNRQILFLRINIFFYFLLARDMSSVWPGFRKTFSSVIYEFVISAKFKL